MFELPELSTDEIKKEGTKFILKCADFKGRGVEAEFVFTGKAQRFDWLSGLHPVPR